MKIFSAEQIDLVIIEKKNQHINRELYNSVYQLWLETWKRVFGEKNLAHLTDPDDFFRQDVIFCLTHGKEVTGFMMGTAFDLSFQAHQDHSYMGGLDSGFRDNLRQSTNTSLMSFEYLTLNPFYRKSVTGIALSEVLLYLMAAYAQENGYAWGIGTARVDVKVDNMCEKIGYEAVGLPVQKYDYQCQAMGCSQGSKLGHPDPAHQKVIDRLMLKFSPRKQQAA